MQQYPQQPGHPQSGYPAPGYLQQPSYPAPGYPQQPGYAAPGSVGPVSQPSAHALAAAVPAAEAVAKPKKPKGPASPLATTGLILGVIGVVGGIFFGWTLLLSIAAVVLGFSARSREPHARGVALGAIVTGFVGIVLALGWLAYSILTWLALTAS